MITSPNLFIHCYCLTYEIYFGFIDVFQGYFGLKRSPSSKNTSRAGSSEDLLSDNTSVASDVSDSSFNTSFPGRGSIPARNKVKGPIFQELLIIIIRHCLNVSG